MASTRNAVALIEVLTRGHTDVAVQAFRNWKSLTRDPESGRLLSASQCVDLAWQQKAKRPKKRADGQ